MGSELFRKIIHLFFYIYYKVQKYCKVVLCRAPTNATRRIPRTVPKNSYFT